MTVSETPDYDPRYDRAQTIDGAKARYVSDACPDYGEAMLEADLERLLSDGAWPDHDEEIPEGLRKAAIMRPEELKPNLSEFGSNRTWQV